MKNKKQFRTYDTFAIAFEKWIKENMVLGQVKKQDSIRNCVPFIPLNASSHWGKVYSRMYQAGILRRMTWCQSTTDTRRGGNSWFVKRIK